MSKRTAKFISALVVTMLAGASFTASAENGPESADSTKTADTCLSAPKGTAPAGSHWYYRLERSSKRKCWYVREASSKAAKAASVQQESSPPAETASPLQPAASISPSVADARAELTSSQAGTRQNPASALDNAPSTVNAIGSSSLLSARWLDQSSMASPGSKVAANDTAATPPEEPEAATQPVSPPAPAATAHSTVEKQSTSTQTLLFIMAGTLALAGLVGGVIFRLNRARTPPYEVDNEWRAPWDRDHAGRAPQLAAQHEIPPHAVEPPRPRRAETAQPEPSFEDTQRQIKEMLARLAKSATA